MQAEADLERLQRRLERERAARREAEAIAEKGLRELWERQRDLKLVKTIAKAANQSKTSREAMALTLEEVCSLTGWPVGHVFLTRRSRSGPVMAPTSIWRGAERAGLTAFRRASESLSFAPGEGLPGRVLQSGAPAWIGRLEQDAAFPRASAAIDAGLCTALAFPVLVRREVAAVLEFFTPEPQEPDEKLLALMGQVGAQLGRAVERERHETRLKAKNARLQRLVAEAEAQRQAAEASSRAKSAFLAVTSHEVRTPLNAVLGLAEALKRQPLGPRQEDLVDGILDSGNMLLRLLNAVLDLSKIEAGQTALHERAFALDETVQTVARVWRTQATAGGVALEVDLKGLPRPCVIVADDGKLEQSLVNLVSNALKFTPPGGTVRIAAQASPSAAGLEVQVAVEDDGPGVAEEDRARILEPYVQTQAGREAGGAGLGLSICVGNLARMGGQVGVEAAALGGARFVLKFPARIDRAAAPAPPAAAVATAGALRVLAAEDNAANRQVLRLLLESAGVTLSFAENGLEALQAVQAERFDLVLMDAAMPVMDGVAALAAIRALPGEAAQTPIHMLTANAFEDDVRRYLAAGADGVLAKPVDVPRLFALMTAVAEGAPHSVRAAAQPSARQTGGA